MNAFSVSCLARLNNKTVSRSVRFACITTIRDSCDRVTPDAVAHHDGGRRRAYPHGVWRSCLKRRSFVVRLARGGADSAGIEGLTPGWDHKTAVEQVFGLGRSRRLWDEGLKR